MCLVRTCSQVTAALTLVRRHWRQRVPSPFKNPAATKASVQVCVSSQTPSGEYLTGGLRTNKPTKPPSINLAKDNSPGDEKFNLPDVTSCETNVSSTHTKREQLPSEARRLYTNIHGTMFFTYPTHNMHDGGRQPRKSPVTRLITLVCGLTWSSEQHVIANIIADTGRNPSSY